VRADSAGTDPADVLNPTVVTALAERGITLAGVAPKPRPTNLTSTDTTERNAGMLRVPLVVSADPAGYWVWLLVALVVVAVAQRRLGPSSSTTTSTTDRAPPSSAVQVRCWSRPSTTTRLPLARDWLACLAWSRHTTTVKNDAS